MTIHIELTAQEIASLKQITKVDSDGEVVTRAAREFLRLNRLRELKAVSGKVDYENNWQELPTTDSIHDLTAFWNSHDLTDYEEELEEVSEPVFVREGALEIPLQASEAEALDHIAKSKGVSKEMLVREWVRQKLKSFEERPRNGSRKKFDAALRKAPDVEPEGSDRLPAKRTSNKSTSRGRGKGKG
jgi:hypothetical protein